MSDLEQFNTKVPKGTADLARRAAESKGLPLGAYVAQLIEDDTSGERARFLQVATEVLDEHAGLFEELEDGDRAQGGAAAA